MKTSPDVEHRYTYRIDLREPGLGDLCVIMKNPSWPDVDTNNSFQGAVRWATARDFSSVTFLNLFAQRSPDPRGLNEFTYSDAVGPENDWEIAEEVEASDLVIGAWGGRSGVRSDFYDRRTEEVVRLVGRERLTRVGTRTKDGYPRHPLFWKSNLRLTSW